jgi:hypothetical protein
MFPGLMNNIMQRSFEHAQAAAHAQFAERQRQESQALADVASREANQKAVEAQKLIDKQNLEARLIKALQELADVNTEAVEITSIFKEGGDIKEQFLKDNDNALEIALVYCSTKSVKVLLENGVRYENWKELVDKNTDIYKICNDYEVQDMLKSLKNCLERRKMPAEKPDPHTLPAKSDGKKI